MSRRSAIELQGAYLDAILDEKNSPESLRIALDGLARLYSEIGGITPDRSFDGWRHDTLLDHGVAINPQAAAFCIRDYRRSVMFIRGVYAALQLLQNRFSAQPIRVLYAGCGPFALLLLPLLGRLTPGRFDIHFLDIHQTSLDSVARLVSHFSSGHQRINYVQADACHYQHGERVHLVIAETMQKSLEQEPQFAVTANLAPQLCHNGVFIPEKIEVELCLAQLQEEAATVKNAAAIYPQVVAAIGRRHSLGQLFTLDPGHAASQLRAARYHPDSSLREIDLVNVQIPALENLATLDAALFTRIQVFANYRLDDYESEISLPAKCPELSTLRPGACYRASYQLGSYPRFNLRKTSAS